MGTSTFIHNRTGDSTFSVAAPQLWSRFNSDLVNASSLLSFNHDLVNATSLLSFNLDLVNATSLLSWIMI